MAGLLSDIGSVCNTFNSVNKVKQFGSDILNSAGQSLGILEKQYNTTNTDVTSGFPSNGKTTASGNDLRGIIQVFRNNTYSFKYGKDFKCFQDDGYFNGQQAKNFKNKVQQVALYQFQPYHQSQLGSIVKNLKSMSKKQKRALAESVAKQIVGAITDVKLAKNLFINDIAANPQAFYADGDNIASDFYSKKKYFNNGSEDPDAATTKFSQMNQIKNMFRNGKWLNTYILPIFQQSTFNKTFYFDQPYSTWQKNSSSKSEDPISQVMNTVLNPIATNEHTLLKTPIWTAVPGRFDEQRI